MPFLPQLCAYTRIHACIRNGRVLRTCIIRETGSRNELADSEKRLAKAADNRAAGSLISAEFVSVIGGFVI